MRHNTGIDFVQPSGGDLLHIHHVLLESEESPTLPSGSLWYEPTDGQVETLTYQGASGVFGVKTVQGLGYYENTDLQEMNPGPYIIQWTRALVEDNIVTFLAANDEDIILSVGGLYKLTYHIQFINNTGGNNDTTLQARVLQNGVGVDGTLMASYLPTGGSGGETKLSCYTMVVAQLGDTISLEVDFLDSVLSSVDVSTSYLEVEFIRK